MAIIPAEEQLIKLDKLSVISDHVQDISRKIAELTDDPLPGQLEQSIPGYNCILALHSEMLKRRRWMFVVAGDSGLVKAAFLNALLDMKTEDSGQLENILPLCHRCPVTISYGGCGGYTHRFLVSVEGPGLCDPIILENWATLKQFMQQVNEGPSETSITWITMHLDSKILQDNLELLIYPVEITERNLDQLLDALSNSDVLLYIADKDNLDSTEKFQLFTTEMRSLRILHQQLQPLVMINCCLTILLGRTQVCDSSESGAKRGISVSLLDDVTCSIEEADHSSFNQSVSSSSQNGSSSDSGSLHTILKAMTRTLTSSVDSRVLFHYGWLNSYVSRVLHHLKSFLNQAERSHEGRLETYKDILARLTALTERSEAFLLALQMEVDVKSKEGITLLRNHLMQDDVIEHLSTWTEEEAPDEELKMMNSQTKFGRFHLEHVQGQQYMRCLKMQQNLWSDIEAAIRQKIQLRLRHEMLSWERNTKFFEVQRPRLIQLFEYRFRGIKTRLSSVETMICRHDSRLEVSDNDSPSHCSQSTVTDDAGLTLPLMLPFNITLHWRQKLAIGLAAPLLIPLAFAAALLGLPIIGGLAAKEFVSEKLSESKIREYKANKTAYLQRRTKEAVKAFVKSTDLDEFVQSQLGSASRCIGQLRQEVPRQIEADRAQIISLRDDDRETTDLERFYQPLLEVFEHCRLLLLTFRVLHIKRDKLEINFEELRMPSDSSCVVCDGLSGRIVTVQWTRKQMKHRENEPTVKNDARVAALKYISYKLDAKSVEDYLMEEEAYRFQACPNIVKLLAVTKSKGHLYHLLEPIQVSVRQHLAVAPELAPPSSIRVKLTYLRKIVLQMLRGLDYLHDRGWVHFDLSLDSLGIGADAVVKLTNISCRKMFFVPRDVTTSGLLRFTHLPPEVLVYPPASYTPSAEMYSVGIAMYEMWTGEHAYWRDICSSTTTAENPAELGTDPGEVNESAFVIDSVDKFLAFVEAHRPSLRRIHSSETDSSHVGEEERVIWSDLMQRCWTEGERVTCKALLQLVEGCEGQMTISVEEGYFDKC